jgi:hypothetical protein
MVAIRLGAYLSCLKQDYYSSNHVHWLQIAGSGHVLWVHGSDPKHMTRTLD